MSNATKHSRLPFYVNRSTTKKQRARNRYTAIAAPLRKTPRRLQVALGVVPQ